LWPNGKQKQCPAKHYTENKRFRNANLTKRQWESALKGSLVPEPLLASVVLINKHPVLSHGRKNTEFWLWPTEYVLGHLTRKVCQRGNHKHEIERQTKQWPNEKLQKDKQWSTKHYTETKLLIEQHEHYFEWGWKLMLSKGKQFLYSITMKIHKQSMLVW
jgi:hypothetical protein